MNDKHKTKAMLIEEIGELRKEIGALKKSREVSATEGIHNDKKRQSIKEGGTIGELPQSISAIINALKDSERKYRTLFEESKDVLYIGKPDGKLLDINLAGVELFGYDSKVEMLDISIERDLFVNFQERQFCMRALEEQGFIKDYEVVMKKKNGVHVTVLMTAIIDRDETGKLTTYRGIMKDVTEWKRLEQQLFQAQKMEAVGQLAGGIAHDFNNILTAIIGYGNLLKAQMPDGPLMTYLNHILDSADRAAKLIQDLLAFSRRQMISPRLINLNEIVKGIENILSRLIGDDIELSVQFTDRKLAVIADGTQIEQVLMNLATNARDAMPDGGSLFISTELAYIDDRFIKTYGYGRAGEYALITFSDTGSGMDEKTKEKIFEPFFSTKEVGKGTGLGLAMVYGIVKQHNGYVNVYSEAGNGTTFRIYLPLMRKETGERKKAELLTLTGGKETILLAEDDFSVRKFIRVLLEGVGYTVIEAGDGEEALKAFVEHKDSVKMLILDIMMPKKNGKEVFENIRGLKPQVKALFISGYTSDMVHQKKIVEEGFDVISKPVSSVKLLTKVREILEKYGAEFG
jgi:PAS domain S-box-containing protein